MAVHGVKMTRKALYTCVRAVGASSPRHRCMAGRANCHLRDRWIDHARAYVRDRLPAIYVSHPYGYDARELAEVCRRYDLACFVYSKDDSWYYPGGTDMLAFVARADRARYLADEARREVVPAELIPVRP